MKGAGETTGLVILVPNEEQLTVGSSVVTTLSYNGKKYVLPKSLAVVLDKRVNNINQALQHPKYDFLKDEDGYRLSITPEMCSPEVQQLMMAWQTRCIKRSFLFPLALAKAYAEGKTPFRMVYSPTKKQKTSHSISGNGPSSRSSDAFKKGSEEVVVVKEEEEEEEEEDEKEAEKEEEEDEREEEDEENSSAQEVFQRGERFLEEKKVELARKCYRNAIKLQHTNPLYWSRLGYTYFMEGKYEEALNPFLHALDMDKTDPVNFLDFGNVQWNLALTEDEPYRTLGLNRAVSSFQTAIVLQPLGAAYYGLSLALNDLGRLEEAEVAIEQAIWIGEPIPDIYTHKANILSAKRLELLKRGEKLKSRREQEELHAQVSQLGIEIESYFFRALRECPDYSDGWNNLGVYYFNIGNSGRAVYCYKKAIEAQPDDPIAQENLQEVQGVRPTPFKIPVRIKNEPERF